MEGHGVALGRVALVGPMLKDGRLVAQPDVDMGVSDYAYWLIRAADVPRNEVGILFDWLEQQAGYDFISTLNWMKDRNRPKSDAHSQGQRRR